MVDHRAEVSIWVNRHRAQAIFPTALAEAAVKATKVVQMVKATTGAGQEVREARNEDPTVERFLSTV